MTDDWFDPSGWATGATTVAILKALNRLRKEFFRRKKAARAKGARDLEKEVDALEADLQRLIELMTKHLISNRKAWESIVNLLGPKDVPADKRPVAVLLKHFPLIRVTADATKLLQDVVLAHENRLKALESAPAGRAARAPKQKARRAPKPKARRRS